MLIADGDRVPTTPGEGRNGSGVGASNAGLHLNTSRRADNPTTTIVAKASSETLDDYDVRQFIGADLDDTVIIVSSASNVDTVVEEEESGGSPSEVNWGLIPLVGGSVLHDHFYHGIKRCIDVACSLVAIVALLPLLVLVGLSVRLCSHGPAIYVHQRVGRRGRLFRCYKFRTMVRDAEQQKAGLAHRNAHSDSRTFKIPNDPRVTRLGLFLRRTSIDELPQLFNVLIGSMSIVGPRPALLEEVVLYSSEDKQRLAVTPGLTCIWQVSGRSKLAFPEQVKLDIEYIRQRGLFLDLKLIALTVPAVCTSDGAY